MYQLTMQDVTYRDYPIQYFSSPSTGIEDIDIIDIWDSVLSNWARERPKRPFYHSLISLLETDLSSIWPHFEIKSETSSIEGVGREKATETISEEDIALEMIKHDFVTKMSPKKKYKIHVLVRSVRRGEPRIVESDEFLFWKGE